MPNKVKPKRSYTAGAVPTTSDLDTNECAINWTDGKLFVKNVAGQIVTVTLGGGGGSGEDAVLRALFVPAAPTSVTATAGNAQATVSWTAPTGVLAQAPITDYVVQYSSNSGSSWVTFSDGSSTATSATVTGLTNGTAYTFRVAGVNAVGTGAYTAASAAVTPVTATPDTLFQNVSLLLHMDGTGSTFIDSSSTPKTITAVGNATQSTSQSKWGGKSAYFDGTGDCVRSNATSGVVFDQNDYCVEFWLYITAAATNHAYGSCLFDTRSESSSYLTGMAVFLNNSGVLTTYERNSEGTSSQPSVVPFNQWCHIAVARSSSNTRVYVNGTSVLSYTQVSSHSGNQLTLGSAADQIDASGNFKLTGYIDDFRVTQNSSRYTGATITVPTAAFPDFGPISAPTSLAATGGNAQASLAWAAPSYNGGSAITDYSVQFSSNGGSTWSNFSRTASTTASQIVTGLANGTAYVFRVAGVNAAGTGTYTSASSSVTPSAGPPVTLSTPYGAVTGSGTVGSKWAWQSGSGFSEGTSAKLLTATGSVTLQATLAQTGAGNCDSGESLSLGIYSAANARIRTMSTNPETLTAGQYIQMELVCTHGRAEVWVV